MSNEGYEGKVYIMSETGTIPPRKVCVSETLEELIEKERESFKQSLIEQEKENEYGKSLTPYLDTINEFGYRMGEAIQSVVQLINNSLENTKDIFGESHETIGQSIDEAKQIEILEERKKHCKNYLELKQINRELNILKFKKGRKIK